MEPDDDSRVLFGQIRGWFDKATSAVGNRLRESVRRDSKGRSRSFINGQATCDRGRQCPVMSYGTRSKLEVDRRTVPECRLSHQARNWQWRTTAEETMLETRERERGQEKFVKKRVRAEFDEVTSFWKSSNAEVLAAMSNLPSASLTTYGNLNHLSGWSEQGELLSKPCTRSTMHQSFPW